MLVAISSSMRLDMTKDRKQIKGRGEVLSREKAGSFDLHEGRKLDGCALQEAQESEPQYGDGRDLDQNLGSRGLLGLPGRKVGAGQNYEQGVPRQDDCPGACPGERSTQGKKYKKKKNTR